MSSASDARAHSWLELRALNAREDRADSNDDDTRRQRKIRLQAFQCVSRSLALSPDGAAPTPLVLACAEGDYPIAEWLLDHGDCVSDLDYQRRSAMHLFA